MVFIGAIFFRCQVLSWHQLYLEAVTHNKIHNIKCYLAPAVSLFFKNKAMTMRITTAFFVDFFFRHPNGCVLQQDNLPAIGNKTLK